ncbi:MAG: FHA domain-containing protein [Solirubrobacteraceae bacterium]
MDNSARERETVDVEGHGSLRDCIARTLNTAYGDGLLSESTLAHRLDVLCASHVIDPAGLLGDLPTGPARPSLLTTVARVATDARRALLGPEPAQSNRAPTARTLLALDWDGGHDELLVGRHPVCDIVLDDLSVSRRHARLRFRDGRWVLQDLESTNGTLVNGESVGRCQLRPGDEVHLGDVRLLVD